MAVSQPTGFGIWGLGTYLTDTVYEVGLKKSIPAQIRQLILYHYQLKEQVDGFLRELTFTIRLYEHSV